MNQKSEKTLFLRKSVLESILASGILKGQIAAFFGKSIFTVQNWLRDHMKYLDKTMQPDNRKPDPSELLDPNILHMVKRQCGYETIDEMLTTNPSE